MSFDWLSFLSSRGIPFVVDGPNVPRGDIAAVRCPWCGASDPSQHLTIGSQGFHCWRNREHKGKNPVRLVQALLHCTIDQAREITGHNSIHVPDDFLSMVQRNLEPPASIKPRELILPKEFRPFRHLPSARPFISYLKSRCFTSRNILDDFKLYDIRYCVDGPFKGRIIFPVTFQNKLVSWTGRSISPRATVRYKSLTTDPELAKDQGISPAVGPINHYLLWFDNLIRLNYHTIVLCEGPFDSLKVNILGKPHGICSTCFFTSSPTDQQIDLFHELLPRFKRKILLLDRGTLSTALRIGGQLRDLGVNIKQLTHQKDPAEINSYDELLKTLAI